MESQEIERVLHQLCDIAAEQTLARFRAAIDIENKEAAGFDPVTEADSAAERALRDHIGERFPDHGFIGEEEAPHQPEAKYCWIVDPIDGTRAFISGLPSWGTLIGLTCDGTPIAGAMHQPFTGEKFVATGEIAYLERGRTITPLSTRSARRIEETTLMTTSPFLFSAEGAARYNRLERRCRLVRYGFDCYAYAMVAAGHVDIVVESGLKVFDIAALIPLIEQAGGVVTNWQGGPAIDGGDIVACGDAAIHAEVLAHLG